MPRRRCRRDKNAVTPRSNDHKDGGDGRGSGRGSTRAILRRGQSGDGRLHLHPALPGGNKISVDYNSGGKSITLFYPNGETLRMPIQRSGSGFRYGEGNVGIAGKGQTTITLQIAGQPARQCVTPR